MSIYGNAVRRPITTIMIFVALMVMGIYSLNKLPIDFYPDIDFPAISVITTYSGASAADASLIFALPSATLTLRTRFIFIICKHNTHSFSIFIKKQNSKMRKLSRSLEIAFWFSSQTFFMAYQKKPAIRESYHVPSR